MQRKLLTALALAAALVAVPAAALGDSSRHAANSTTFPDSVGEDAAAPDITSVVVSNDDSRMITFQINLSNRPAFTPDMYFLVFVDSDNNAATGAADFDGAEYAVQLSPGDVFLYQWNGTDFVAASAQTSLTYAYPTTGPEIHIGAKDLGNTKALRFAVIAVSGVVVDASGNPDFTNVHRDAAPDPGHGLYSYAVLAKLILSVTAFTTSPRPAKAGRPFSATLAANENDTAGPAQAGTVGCNATVAFKRIVALTHLLTNGVASCVWRIPATAKGKVLRGTITLTVQGVKVTRTFSSKIG